MVNYGKGFSSGNFEHSQRWIGTVGLCITIWEKVVERQGHYV